jgi:hypothetical protein
MNSETVLTPSALQELRRLYALLADVVSSAAKTLGEADALPSGLAAEGLKVLNAQAAEIIDRIRTMIG